MGSHIIFMLPTKNNRSKNKDDKTITAAIFLPKVIDHHEKWSEYNTQVMYFNIS